MKGFNDARSEADHCISCQRVKGYCCRPPARGRVGPTAVTPLWRDWLPGGHQRHGVVGADRAVREGRADQVFLWGKVRCCGDILGHALCAGGDRVGTMSWRWAAASRAPPAPLRALRLGTALRATDQCLVGFVAGLPAPLVGAQVGRRRRLADPLVGVLAPVTAATRRKNACLSLSTEPRPPMTTPSSSSWTCGSRFYVGAGRSFAIDGHEQRG